MRKYVTLFLLANSYLLNSMERQPTELILPAAIQTRDRTPDSATSEEDELCDFAVSHTPAVAKYIRPFLKEIIQPEINKRYDTQRSDSVRKLVRIKSGNEPDSPDNRQVVQDIVMQAVEKALIHHENLSALQEKIIAAQCSRRATAIIAGASSVLSIVVTALTTFYSR